MIDEQISIFSEVLQLNSGSAVGGRLNASQTELDLSWPGIRELKRRRPWRSFAGRGEIQFESQRQAASTRIALRLPGTTGGHAAATEPSSIGD
ncbi:MULTISPECIES: hypothetical protein [Bradyrhizobium]|uniref:hypothetical protein n=1 Tax=Bradyrhizobium australafricanum TaxID=2821406 RepID=UPI001CE3813A|nr:hypothetical protein [Bradyrhizobium australafricanum]MCA6098091.1 hypothetical protein [Bradyrhizobium australafricanum]